MLQHFANRIQAGTSATMAVLLGLISGNLAFPGAAELAAHMDEILPPEQIQDAQEEAPVAVAAPRRPYSFSYTATDPRDGSSHGRSESADVTGRVTGFYTLRTADGRSRRVNYVADERGFRAEVLTNEPGTASLNPANVVFRSSARLPFPSRGPSSSAAASAAAAAASAAAASAATSYVPVSVVLPSQSERHTARTITVPPGHRAIIVPIEQEDDAAGK
ncbi:adult-specific rigid cuticular protein 15.7-like [Dermacentor albipictus]|uniref:adult-specific rigid cuticular protein 15.7-like n=1 Tax=Dermacentor albipictus TaxID=60249 RepID=UPI0031FD4F25